jgi:outer membrane protein, adhesin transport system
MNNTRIALYVTASVASLNAVSLADADFEMSPAGSAVADTAELTAASLPNSMPALAAPDARNGSMELGNFEKRFDRLVGELPTESGNAATPIAEIAAAPMPVSAGSMVPVVPVETAVAAVPIPEIAINIETEAAPAVGAELAATVAIEPLPQPGQLIATPIAPLPDIAPVVEVTAVAASATEPASMPNVVAVADAVSTPVQTATVPLAAPLVTAPEAPRYIFFDDAGTAPAPAVSAAAAAGMVYSSENVSLEQAISAALETNPEVNQAIMNKEAIEFEREQAQGLYAPRVDIEASAGVRRLENNTRRTLGIANQELYPLEAGISAEYTLVDFGRRHGELMRQAARTDGAALRVGERSENIALLVTRQYLDILLQQRIVAAAEDNVTFHRNLVRDLGTGVQQGSISIADQQQAQERLQAAIVRKTEAEEAMVNAQISLQTLTGLSVNSVTVPTSKRAALSPTINDAIAQARQENPKVLEAMADVDAAHAMIEKANGDLHPTIGIEARGRVGEDIDGFRGETNDVQARVVLKWNIFDGGINRAKVQEMNRRASEARFRLHELVRYAEEDVRTAWNSMSTQDKVGKELEVQSRVSDDLLLSYREQFNVGRRSLLDVLDAQNTRYNAQVRLETARFAEQFAEYQVLAATNDLLDTMGLKAPAASDAYAREKYNYGPSDPAETDRRRYPR